MRPEPLISQLSSIGGFRLLGSLAVLGLGMSLVAMGVFADRLLEEQSRIMMLARIENVSKILVEDFERSGVEELRAEIATRVRGEADAGRLRFSLKASDGTILFDMAKHSLDHRGWIEHAVSGGKIELGYTQVLSDGSVLAISGTVASYKTDNLAHIITTVGGAVMLLAAMYAWLSMRASTRAANAMGGTLDRIAGGDLSQRLSPQSGSANLGDMRERLNETLDALQRRDADMRAALQVVAHEMRTPLSHIHQRLQVLRDPEASDTERDAALDAMDERLRFVQASYDAILRLMHLRSDKIRTQTFDLAERARNVGEAYSASFTECGCTLDLACHSALIDGDPDLIDIAIAALLDNAMRHTPRGTSVEIATWTQTGASMVRVSDNGPGMPDESRVHAADRFYHGPASTGFGLGLTIVAAIAERLGGGLSIDDANPGLAVTLTLPSKAI